MTESRGSERMGKSTVKREKIRWALDTCSCVLVYSCEPHHSRPCHKMQWEYIESLCKKHANFIMTHVFEQQKYLNSKKAKKGFKERFTYPSPGVVTVSLVKSKRKRKP